MILICPLNYRRCPLLHCYNNVRFFFLQDFLHSCIRFMKSKFGVPPLHPSWTNHPKNFPANFKSRRFFYGFIFMVWSIPGQIYQFYIISNRSINFSALFCTIHQNRFMSSSRHFICELNKDPIHSSIVPYKLSNPDYQNFHAIFSVRISNAKTQTHFPQCCKMGYTLVSFKASLWLLL